MHTTTSIRRRRLIAGITAVGLAFAGALAGATAASAAGSPGNINPEATGSITIHKYEQPGEAYDVPNNGSQQSMPSDAVALAGVEFTVTPVTAVNGVTLDMTDPATWEAIDGLTAADLDSAGATYGTPSSATTDAAGSVMFDDLDLGVYLVTETDPGSNNIVRPASPFLVSIPLNSSGTWLYDVHVYPKNSVTSVEKDVVDTDAYGTGDEVQWPITVRIPALADGEQFTNFTITDELDSRLGYVSYALTIDGTPVTDVTETSVPGTAGGGTLQLDFIGAQQDALLENPNAELKLVITTTVLSIDASGDAADGVIVNEVDLNVNGTSVYDTAETHWGPLRIFKYTTVSDAQVPLANAVFSIYLTEADAAAGTGALTVGGETEFASNSDGIVLVDGLKVGTYWIVEVQAPAGYEPMTTPIEVTITTGGTDVTVNNAAVKNVPKKPFELPLTGAQGTLLFIGIGVALLLSATGVAIWLRRTEHDAAA